LDTDEEKGMVNSNKYVASEPAIIDLYPQSENMNTPSFNIIESSNTYTYTDLHNMQKKRSHEGWNFVDLNRKFNDKDRPQ